MASPVEGNDAIKLSFDRLDLTRSIRCYEVSIARAVAAVLHTPWALNLRRTNVFVCSTGYMADRSFDVRSTL